MARYARRSLPSPTSINVIHSILEEIEKQSQALLAKGGAARFVDKGEDSKEVVNLIERLREAICHYQVSGYRVTVSSAIYMEEQISQQQAIYDQITNLTVWPFLFVSACCNDDRCFYLVVFRCTLESSRGNTIQRVYRRAG